MPRASHLPHLVAVGDAEERDDDALMAAARAGDRAAFDALVRRHQRRVIGFAHKFFDHPALACDVAQDAFVDLLRAVPTYRADGHFRAFLFRLTLNRCRMAARSRRYEDGVGHALPVGETAAADREQERAVQAAMMKLTEKQREILLLRFWGGLSHDEASEALGVPVGTVKSRLFGALEAVRALWSRR